jgi:Icc-related predicted phosphoesterase
MSGEGTVRLAAVGDLHVRSASGGALRADLADVPERADVLLLAGDLTNGGFLDEGRVLAGELADLGVPAVAVLGNHDHDEGHGPEITAMLRTAGVVVLEGDSTSFTIRGVSLGIAGLTGFDGGFGSPLDGLADRRLDHAGEPSPAAPLRDALKKLTTTLRVALTHYAPIPGTLEGEPREIYRYLGNDQLAHAIDGAGADLAIHGHAHLGSEHGETPGGVPVRNVARPVLNRPFATYLLTSHQLN